MALNVTVKGEYRGIGATEFTDRATGEKKTFPYLRIEVEEETQKVSCSEQVAKEVETKIKKGQDVACVVRVYARDNNLKLSFVRWGA